MNLHSTRLYGFVAVIIMVLFLMASSCKSTESMPTDNSTIISIGSFGGFAGTYKEYTIKPNGLLSIKTNVDSEEKQLSKLEEKTVTQLSAVLEELSRNVETTYNPGNMTYFVKFYNGDQDPVEWVWGGGEQTNSRVQAMYRILSKLCKTQEHPIK